MFCLLLGVVFLLTSGTAFSHSNTEGEFCLLLVCWANNFPLQPIFPLGSLPKPGILTPVLNGCLVLPSFSGCCDPLPYTQGFSWASDAAGEEFVTAPGFDLPPSPGPTSSLALTSDFCCPCPFLVPIVVQVRGFEFFVSSIICTVWMNWGIRSQISFQISP